MADVVTPPKPLTILLLSRRGPTKSVETCEKQPDARLSIPIMCESVSKGVMCWAFVVEAYTATAWHINRQRGGLPDIFRRDFGTYLDWRHLSEIYMLMRNGEYRMYSNAEYRIGHLCVHNRGMVMQRYDLIHVTYRIRLPRSQRRKSSSTRIGGSGSDAVIVCSTLSFGRLDCGLDFFVS